jgi:hypothetical protein
MKTKIHLVSTETLNNYPLKQPQGILCQGIDINGFEGIWIVSVGVKEKPSTWEGKHLQNLKSLFR